MARPSRYLTHDGRTLSVREWSERTGIKYTTILQRIDYWGWSVGRALGEPGNARASKTHCVHGHPFDAANTYRDALGYRHCLACQKARLARDAKARDG